LAGTGEDSGITKIPTTRSKYISYYTDSPIKVKSFFTGNSGDTSLTPPPHETSIGLKRETDRKQAPPGRDQEAKDGGVREALGVILSGPFSLLSIIPLND
jgi:hypothetical protein